MSDDALRQALQKLTEAKALVAAALVPLVTARVQAAAAKMPFVKAAFVSPDGASFVMLSDEWAYGYAEAAADVATAIDAEIDMGVYIDGGLEDNAASIAPDWTCVYQRAAVAAA